MSARDLIKIGYSQIYEQNSNPRVNIFIEIIITCYCVMFTIGFNLEGANKSVAKIKLFVEFVVPTRL